MFFENGQYKIGFSINHHQKFLYKFEGANLVAAYGVTFNMRSHYLYKTVTECSGYYIKKYDWQLLLSENMTIAQYLQFKIKKDYKRLEVNV